MKKLFLAWGLLFALASEQFCRAEETSQPSAPTVRATIAQSLPYLETAGAEWIEKRNCISCHRITFMTWGFREAVRHGFEIDRAKLDERLAWSFDTTITKPDPKLPAACAKNPDGIGQLLIGHSSLGAAPLSAEQTTQLVAALLKVQRPDGSWKPEGQLPGQKRPGDETTQVSTMWNLFGLAHAPPTDEIQAARQKGLAWLASAQPGKSTEWFAAALVLRDGDQQPEKVAELTKQLLSHQQADGGWGWLTADPSDALATGQALYALSIAGMKSDAEPIRKAQQFLASTQQENGSWAVKGTKQNRKDKIEETATYWGTAWATIGLLKTLPK